MKVFDLRGTKEIIYNSEKINKMYLGDVLVYSIDTVFPIIYTIDRVTSDLLYLPSGVGILKKEAKGNEINIAVGEGNITFNANDRIMEIKKLKHKQLNSCQRIFYNCANLKKVNLTEFNTENVTTFKEMFAFSTELVELDTTGVNVKNVTSMNKMFLKCLFLEELDLSSFETNNLTDVTGMFDRCRSLKRLDLTNFDTRKIESSFGMFADVPKTCEVYVGKNWTLTEDDAWFDGKFIRV